MQHVIGNAPGDWDAAKMITQLDFQRLASSSQIASLGGAIFKAQLNSTESQDGVSRGGVRNEGCFP